jgi:hypothetical protein
MPDFIIREHVEYTVEAESAQEALDRWLNEGDEAVKYTAVEDRDVFDTNYAPCEVQEP